MALSLVVADNTDGSGGIATVAGSDPATTNTIYAALFAGTIGPQTWTVVGSRTGDGTIAIASPGTLALGMYLWKVIGTVGGQAAFASYYRNLTDSAAKSVWERGLDCYALQVQTLNLAGVSSVNVVERWLPKYIATIDTVPQVIIAPVNVENFPGMMCNRDDVGYPIAVCYVDKQNQHYTANKSRNLLWRQRVSRIFRFQRVAGLTETFWSIPDGGIVIDPGAFDQANVFFGYQVFRCIAREPRGPASV